MTEIRARLATESDPRSASLWVWTEDAIQRAVDQLPGTIVTYNYDAARPLGRVVSAEADGDGLHVTMELGELPPGARTDEVGPGFSVGLDGVRDEHVSYVDDLRVREVALLPPDPLEVRTFDGRWRDWVVIVVAAVALLAFWAGVGYLAGVFG